VKRNQPELKINKTFQTPRQENTNSTTQCLHYYSLVVIHWYATLVDIWSEYYVVFMVLQPTVTQICAIYLQRFHLEESRVVPYRF